MTRRAGVSGLELSFNRARAATSVLIFKPHLVTFEDEIHGSAGLDKVGHLAES
jgi:hypothetical protein